MRKCISILAVAAILIGVTIALVRFRPQPDIQPPPEPSVVEHAASPHTDIGQPSDVSSPIRFTPVPADESGVDFEYYGNPSDEHFMTEQNGGGVALFDVDADGRLDLFLANGSHFDRPAEAVGARHRLFRQTADWRFADVTTAAGLEAAGFGQGCAAADYDNDGFRDLFVACYGRNRLWHNNGDGTFSEVTQEAGVGDERWASSAAFADLDGDGNLDLYVVNYVDWTPEQTTGKRIPSPMDFDGLPDLLYRNSGDGQFVEVGVSAGVSIPGEGKGLAVAITDLDGDRLADIYVANDTTRNFLFRNLGGLRFDEVGVPGGCAISEDGSIGSSMGIAVSDYNRDGWPDLFVTNFAQEVLDVFTSVGPAGFIADNAELGVDPTSRPALNFGIVVQDFDADSWPDLFYANGHLWDETAAGGEYRMHPNLMQNARGMKFVDVSQDAGDYFRRTWLARAAASGDMDNDADMDLVVSHLLDPPALLRNDSRRAGNVLQLKLIGVNSAREPRGVRVEAVVGRTIVSHVPAGESFQASQDERVLIPVGAVTTVDELRVYWGGGRVETWTDLPTGQLLLLIENTGES